MTIEGIHEFEHVRDFLYARMRGHGGLSPFSFKVAHPATLEEKGDSPPDIDSVLLEAAASLKEAAELIRSRRGAP